MRLLTFQDDSKRLRVGALAGNEKIVDLAAACALYLREVENETAYYPVAGALVPADMRAFFAGGDRSLGTAQAALRYVMEEQPPVTGQVLIALFSLPSKNRHGTWHRFSPSVLPTR